ncbi:MAG: 23S rRNA (pseudouridine(1915)-N(3))-methyltransferase RlmH [Candidatus Aminicenantes bacterium]|jgi:23S rRNA (pseudouridine1915-N3)-methyltransferase|nr:23S rRNA (pseudouridine(1915)-N(3))-methyltransferase RlmH [Candidatus Aminicenantes bacterium]
MKKIVIVSVGDLKFKELKELEKKYIKKISHFIKLETVNLKDVAVRDEEIKKKKEGQMMLNLLEKRDFVIACDEKGKQMDSLTFSRFLSEKLSYHPGRIVFLIGGHSGLSSLLNDRINLKLSFSHMTFAHDIFRILFLEQLYRAFTIMKGITYHR